MAISESPTTVSHTQPARLLDQFRAGSRRLWLETRKPPAGNEEASSWRNHPILRKNRTTNSRNRLQSLSPSLSM